MVIDDYGDSLTFRRIPPELRNFEPIKAPTEKIRKDIINLTLGWESSGPKEIHDELVHRGYRVPLEVVLTEMTDLFHRQNKKA